MGYFPAMNLIPEVVVKHIREQIPYLNKATVFMYDHESSYNRHRRRIYDYLAIKRYEEATRSKLRTMHHKS
jgi:hypothetical protein